MRLNQLFEDQESDKNFRNQALDIYNKFVEFVDKEGLDGFNRTNNGDYYIYSWAHLGIEHTRVLQIRIRFTQDKSKEQRYYDTENEVTAGVDGDRRILIMFVNEKLKDMFSDFIKNPQQRSTFVHELTHLYDSDRSFRQQPSSAEADNLSDYYNSASEFNAYYQQGIDSFEQKIEAFHNNVKKNPQKNTSALQNFLNNKFGGNDFKEFLPIVLNYFDTAFVNWLTDENKKKLKKRLYQYYVENKDELYDLSKSVKS